MHLDPRLRAESTYVTDLKLCQVRLSHNAAFPWIILIPQQDALVEIMDLTPTDQQELMHDIALASQVMQELFHPTKLNVANLGNVVPQLHIHVVARYDTDAAWPGPIWNSGVSESYDSVVMSERINALREAFVGGSVGLTPSPLKQAWAVTLEVYQEGFGWEFPSQAALKVKEELEEVLEELKKPDSPLQQKALIEEMGDLILACVIFARHCNIDPEEALLVGLEKFTKRYERLKSYAAEKGISVQNTPSVDLVSLWKKLKKEKG